MNLRALGLALGRLGDYAGGIAACERALDLAGELGGRTFLQYALHNLGHICDMAGEYDRAVELATRRRELCRAEGDVRGAALSDAVCGDAYCSLGRALLSCCLRHTAISTVSFAATRSIPRRSS